MKKFLVTFLFFLLLSVSAIAQWEYQGAWPDTNYKGGTHGIVVDPDGKIWCAAYYRVNWVSPSNDTILLAPIYVFNPDGTLLDRIGIVTTGSVADTLGNATSTSGARGLAKAHDGNILWCASGPGRLIKINYQTRQGMARHSFVDGQINSSPTKPAVASDGTVFVGPVLGGAGKNIVTFAPDLTYIGAVVPDPANIARTMEVSADGNTIYWTMFTGYMGIDVYTRASEFDPFVLTDSLFRGMSIETATWHPVTGNLWISNDRRALDSAYTHMTWYEVDLTTKTLIDSFSLPFPNDPGNADQLPRALAFSNDGNTAYVGLFGSAFDRIYRFNNVTSVDDPGYTVVNGYKLSQNYPNPFNPSTKISFEIPVSGFVSLKVYDMLGREVSVLVNEEMASGTHTVNFNANDLSTGTYVYQLTSNGNVISNKMVLLK